MTKCAPTARPLRAHARPFQGVSRGLQGRPTGAEDDNKANEKPLHKPGFWLNQAAGVGFEPTEELSPLNGFQDRRGGVRFWLNHAGLRGTRLGCAPVCAPISSLIGFSGGCV